jgi:hypothetical protein
MKAMNPEDPEQYIRGLERGVGQTPWAAPQPFGTDSGSPFGGQGGGPVLGGTSWRRFRGVAKLPNTPTGWLIFACAVMSAFAIALFLGHYAGKTTVRGNLVMINSGAKGTIDCNDGNLKLDGDSNTYTVTGHCRRLEVFGGANHVTVDSADTISVFGDDNVIIYHSGSPTINKTGNNNIVSQRR